MVISDWSFTEENGYHEAMVHLFQGSDPVLFIRLWEQGRILIRDVRNGKAGVVVAERDNSKMALSDMKMASRGIVTSIISSQAQHEVF